MIIDFKKNNGGGGGSYTLPIATPTTLGGVKIGDGINLANDGTISVNDSRMKYVESDNSTIGGVYVQKPNDGIGGCFEGINGSFIIEYDQMFQSQEEQYVELYDDDINYVDFRVKYDYVDDEIKLEYASSVDDFEQWILVSDGDTIEITFGNVIAKAPVSITFNGSVTMNNDLGFIMVKYNADDGWRVEDYPSLISDWTKVADINGNPLPKSFDGMLYNQLGCLQKGDYYLVTNDRNHQIEVDPPYSDIFGIVIENIYLDVDATILQTEYHKEENDLRKGTRAPSPNVRIYRDMENNLVFQVFNGQDTIEYTYDYEDGMSVGIDMDGFALVNGEQQDEIIEGGGMTFLNTFLFGYDEDVDAKCENFYIFQYDVNFGYFELYYEIRLKHNQDHTMSCVFATEGYESIISHYADDIAIPLQSEVFSEEEQRISKLEKAIEDLQNGGGDEVQDDIQVEAAENGVNHFDVNGSFTSSTYNSIWGSYVDSYMYETAIENGEDPNDLEWVKANGNELTSIDNNVFYDYFSVSSHDEWIKVYYFLYDSTNDIVSDETYWENTFYSQQLVEGGDEE